MVEIPHELMKQLLQFCEKNEYGMTHIGGTRYSLILIGGDNIDPNTCAILGAHNLLEGVVSGEFMRMSLAALGEDEDENENGKGKLN